MRPAIITSLLLALLWEVVPPIAHGKDLPEWSRTLPQWGIQEIVLKGSSAGGNPFSDVRVRAKFQCPKQAAVVDGFYDGESTWKVRFMPAVQGSCDFRIESSDAEMDGAAGAFTVGPPEAGNHGPVHIAKTYHFSFADGSPYFLLGTTSYNWLNRDPGLQDKTLAALGRTGFTKLRFGLFPKWYKFNRVEPVVFPYVRKPDGSFDLDRFDPRFFANVEKRIQQLSALGIQADIILFHPYDNWGFADMDEAHNEAWLRYVVARLAAYRNVWWTMANEYDLMTPRDWNRLGQLVRDADPYGHPLGIHNFATWYDAAVPWIDHSIIQDGSAAAGRSASIAGGRYAKPVVVDEYGYEGNNGESWGELTGREEVVRHWDITMAGGYASHGETYVHPGGVLWWSAGGDLVGESPARLTFLKTVMTALPFQEMAPAPELVVNGSALAKSGDAYLFHFPWRPRVTGMPVAQIRLAGKEPYKVELIDPWEMTDTAIGYTSAGDQAFTPPFAPMLLRITAAAGTAGSPQSIGDLLARFAGDVSTAKTANPALFKSEPLKFSPDFQIAQIEQNPAANALLHKYLPKGLLEGRAIVLSLSDAEAFLHMAPDKLNELHDELSKIPVQ